MPQSDSAGKDGRLMQWAIVFLVAMFMIAHCGEDERAARDAKAAEEARIEREVQRRVEVARQEMAERDALLHTVSWIVFVVFTGGAVVGILWVRQHRIAAPVIPVMPANRAVQYSPPAYVIQQPRPQWVNYQAPRTGRVIDLRPVTGTPPVQQTLRQEQPTRVRQRRRRWLRNPDRQTNPPR